LWSSLEGKIFVILGGGIEQDVEPSPLTISRTGFFSKPAHNLQNWVFQHFRMCKLLCRLIFVLCCLAPSFSQIARGFMFLSALNISSSSKLCSEEGKRTETEMAGKGVCY